MIKTSRQLKDLVSNQAKGDSGKSQLLIRNFAMERFLERVSLSSYKDNFIIKGGMLVSAMVGMNNRTTLDIDTTVRNLPLDLRSAEKIIDSIIAVPVGDNIRFTVKSISDIMDEAEYGGVRVSLDAYMDTLRIPLKIDISTGDVITPRQITYQYRLMFEERFLDVWAYTIETVLAEKMESILSKALMNTRMRDFYDLYILQNSDLEIDKKILSDALRATAQKRNSIDILQDYDYTLGKLEVSNTMMELWKNYQKKYRYASGIDWSTAIGAVRSLCSDCIE